MSNEEKLTSIIKHIKRVEDNCNELARKIMPTDLRFALHLIRLGRIHDASKFDDLEFHHLHKGEPRFNEALERHHHINLHHPECWIGGIKQMSDIYLAEMVCDCVARGQLFGSDTRKWFSEEATVKYGFTMEDRCGQRIEYYLNLLLTEPFK